MEKETAANEFAKMLFQTGVEKGLNTLFDCLQHPAGLHKPTWEAVREWYDKQTPGEKELVAFLVKEAAVLAVFGIAVNFDGAAGYHWVGDQVGEFTVTLRIYAGLEEAGEQPPLDEIEICPTSDGEDIHDIFLNLVDEAEPILLQLETSEDSVSSG